MTTLRRLFRNTSVLIVANAIQPLLSFYLIVTISRVLEVEGLGAYATVFNYQAIFQIFAAFGLRNLLTRNLAQQPQATARYLWHGSLLVLPFSLLSIVGLIALTALLQYPELVFWATVIVSASLIAAALIEVGEGVLAGLERLHMVGYSAIFENVLRVGLSLIVLAKGYGLLALVWIFVASRYSRALFYFWYIHRHLLPASVVARGKLDLDWTFARQLLRQAPVFALTMICVTVYWKVDISILSKARGLEEVGLYSAAFRFLMLAMVVVDSFVNSLFPIISNYYRHAAEGSRDQFEVACKKGLQLLLVLTVPVALALSLLADQIILLVYGEKYIGAIPALRILIWVVVPYAISQIFAYALVASNNQRYDFFVNAVSMVCNMMLNWILIQQFGYIGAAWSAALAILIYVAVQVPFVLHRVLTFDVKRLLFGGLKVVIATVLMAIFILFFPQIKIWFLVPLAFVLYLLTLIAAKTFSRNDWLLATRLLK